MKKGSSLVKLSRFLDEHGILRVGGRIQNSDIPFLKHPLWSIFNIERNKMQWLLGDQWALVRFIISKCLKCRILRGNCSNPRMSDLPFDLINPFPPFIYCGLDMFGPFVIRERRSDYAIIFTCLSLSLIHI